jgi:excisionase family DNA binding protein
VLRSAELQISRLCSAKDGAAGAGGLVLSRAWTSSWTARRFRALQRTTDVSATTKHVRSALRMRDVDRTPHGWRLPTIHLSATTGRKEMINELDRLMTITDLSEMLGVPVDTLYGWRHRGEGPEGYRIGRHVRYRRAAVEAWLDTQADRRQR